MKYNKIKLKPKHHKLINHFCNFIDRRWYPDYIPTEEQKEYFIRLQTYGPKSLTQQELESIKPLINAQELKELTIKMVVDDIGFFWSKHWGWYVPLSHNIYMSFKDRHKTKDNIYIRALIKIARNIQENGIVEFLSNYTGHDSKWKQRVFGRYLGENN